jgi:hypothetical protein
MTTRPQSDQAIGGTLTIPDGYAVIGVDLDADFPFCTIIKESDDQDEHKLEIPKSLAYYLTTHHNGSFKFRDRIRTDAQNQLRSKIRQLLQHSDTAPDFE